MKYKEEKRTANLQLAVVTRKTQLSNCVESLGVTAVEGLLFGGLSRAIQSSLLDHYKAGTCMKLDCIGSPLRRRVYTSSLTPSKNC